MEQLPPATQEGRNTFGCLVNGEIWIPQGYNGTANLDLSYDPGYRGGTFNLSAYNYFGNGDDDKQTISIYSDSLKREATYLLNDPEHAAPLFNDRSTGCSYYRESNVFREGSLTITRFDLENQVISGTFEFTLAKPGCDTIRVTEGRFDMKI